MKKINKMLEEWVMNNLITHEQMIHIIHYEKNKKQETWYLSNFFILGILTIALGLISLIAANWYLIDPKIKLGVDFLFLLSTGYAILHFRNHSSRYIFDGLIIFLMLLCLASLGLIYQIYHLTYPLSHTLFFWNIITLGLILHLRYYPAIQSWVGSLALSLILMTSGSEYFYRNEIPILLFFTLLFSLTTITFHHYNTNPLMTKAFRETSLILAMIGLCLLEFFGHTKKFIIEYQVQYPTAMFWYQMSSFMAITLIFIIFKNKSYHKKQKVLMTTALFFYILAFYFPFYPHIPFHFYAFITMIILFLLALLQASLKHEKIFNYLIQLLAIRFVIFYLQNIQGLVKTGLHLVFVGLSLLIFAILWKKYKPLITSYIERWIYHVE
jgi:uncharacterized membrane protein